MGSRDQALGFIRHVVTFVGGILVARGKIDVAQVETIAGVIVTVAGLVFSFLAPEKKVETVEKTVTQTTEVKPTA